MFRLWTRNPSSSAYNSGFSAVVQGDLNVAALQSAAQLVFERQQVGLLHLIVGCILVLDATISCKSCPDKF